MYKLQSALNLAAEKFLEENEAIEVAAKDIGLDSRSCSTLYLSQNFVAKKGCTRSLNYYGGFQYIEENHVYKAGEYTFYSSDDDRILDCIRHYNEELSSQALHDQVEAEMEEGEQEN